MKKLIALFAISAMVFASCAKIEEKTVLSQNEGVNSLTVTATIADQTRVSYAEGLGETPSLKAAWDAEDTIFGFDDKGNKLTFKVKEIKEGKAFFELTDGTPAGDATKLHMIYYPGKSTADIDGTSLAVDISAQSVGAPDATLPAIMLASGDIVDSKVTLAFSNECAIVAIKGMTIVSGVSKLNELKVGNIITSGTISVSEGNLVLTPAAETALATITNTEGWSVESSTGVFAGNIYFTALPNAEAQTIGLTATVASKEYTWEMTGTTAIAKGTYYRINDKSVTTGAVAEIGAVKYATIAAAFTAANASNDPVTIKLLADCVPTGYLNITNGGSGDVTLDLNGKNISFTTHRLSVLQKRTLNIIDSSTDDVALQGTISTQGTSTSVINVSTLSTLNLYGGNIVAPDDASARTAIQLQTGGTLNLHGGKLSASSTDYGAIYTTSKQDSVCTVNMDGGEVCCSQTAVRINNTNACLTGGKITCTGTGALSAIFVSSSYEATYGCKVTLGGTLDVTSKGYYGARAYVGTINIEGGSYHSDRYPASVNTGKLIVTDGTFSNESAYVTAYQTSTGSIEIKGGKWMSQGSIIGKGDKVAVTSEITGGVFNKSLTASYVKTGYSAEVNLDQTTFDEGYCYTVKESDGLPVATIGGTPYATINDAFTAANVAGTTSTIVLQKGAILNAKVDLVSGADVTLDLNGNSMLVLSTTRVNALAGATYTITDSGSDKKGSYVNTSTANSPTISSSGTLNIDGAKIIAMGTNPAISVSAGNFSMSGGSLYCRQSYGLQVTGTTVATITGGSITSDESIAINNSGNLTIKDGIFTSGKSTVYLINPVACTIEGGSFLCNNTGTATSEIRAVYYGTSTTTQGPLSITGGYFYTKGTASANYAVYRIANTLPLSISGGYYNTQLASAYIATGYGLYNITTPVAHSHGDQTLYYDRRVREK